MTEAIALNEARADFHLRATPTTAAKLLQTAYDAWNESHLSERDYVEEVNAVARWLVSLARQDAA